MYQRDVQSVLRCGQCNKPFDKQSTLKRHGYYCRSRRAASTPRSRSCISCARGKARCDNGQPECSRCTTKALECHYPANTPQSTRKSTLSKTQHSDGLTTERHKIATPSVPYSSSVKGRHDASNDGDITLDGALVMSDTEFEKVGGDYIDWDDPDINFADFLNPQTNDKTAQYVSLGASSVVRHSTPSTNPRVQVKQALSSPILSIPTPPTNTIRSLIQRPKMKTGAQRIANLILHTMKSYPLMMLHHNTLPPFIHPHFISSVVDNDHMEPLNNCITLMHMISSGVQGSRKLFWKNVRLECERLCADHLKLDKWELLAGIQALSIYLLIRLDEGETDYNNLDFLLLVTVTVISQQFARSDITCDYGVEINWENWIFGESRRRLAVVYRVLNMLIYFEPAALCDLQTDLVLAPLPAKKQLWEASDESAWKAESQRKPGMQTAFGLAANGDLVKLDEDQLYCSDETLLYQPLDASAATWEEWCSGIDGFGGLVMLAASLIE